MLQTDFNYTTNRSLDKNTFERLALLDFIKRGENVILTGATGTGKSYLAQALGKSACISSIRRFITTLQTDRPDYSQGSKATTSGS